MHNMCLVRPALLYLNVHVLKVFYEQINYYYYYYYYYYKRKEGQQSSSIVAAAKKFCLQPPPEDGQRWSRGNVRGKTVPDTCASDRECPPTDR